MNAEYTTSLLYPGNPYVEALPPMLAGQELIRALASVPLYSTSDRDRSTGERLQLLSALYEFYQPLTMTLDLYCEVYNAISKTQYLRLAEKSDTIRTWKHDTREAMNGALLLMQQGRTAEAELLLKDRLASMQVETIAIKSGNIIVDAILTQKIDECLDNGIVLDMKVEIPSHIMREEDTCEVFGSILDFAVAVSNKQPTDKKIKIVLQDQDNKLKVFVTANAAVFDSVDATRMTEIEQSTTKILSAYNGIVSAQHDEDQSTITWNLLIPLPQDNEWLASYIYDSSEALSSGVRTVKQ